MTFSNKIEAIKAVRALGSVISVVTNERGEKILDSNRACLRDAKDLVEAIMELGLQQALTEGARRLQQLEAADVTENEHEARLRALATRNMARPLSDDIEF